VDRKNSSAKKVHVLPYSALWFRQCGCILQEEQQVMQHVTIFDKITAHLQMSSIRNSFPMDSHPKQQAFFKENIKLY